MPTYHYHCEACGEDFDLFQGMSSSPIQSCPKCKAPCARQMGAGAGLIVKGGGGSVARAEAAVAAAGPSCASGGCCNCSMAS